MDRGDLAPPPHPLSPAPPVAHLIRLDKIFESSILDYFSSLWSYKLFVLLNSSSRGTLINNTITIPNFHWNNDTVRFFLGWPRVLSWVEVTYCFVGYSILHWFMCLWMIMVPKIFLQEQHNLQYIYIYGYIYIYIYIIIYIYIYINLKAI